VCGHLCACTQARLHVSHAQHAAYTLNAQTHSWTICDLHTSKEMVARMCTEALACTSNVTALSRCERVRCVSTHNNLGS